MSILDGVEMGGAEPTPDQLVVIRREPPSTHRETSEPFAQVKESEGPPWRSGFIVRRLGSTQPVPDPCPYCGGPVNPPVTGWVCEIDGDVLAKQWSGCGCNWCRINLDTRARRGRPRVHCGSVPCKRAHGAKLSRESRERRKLLAAA